MNTRTAGIDVGLAFTEQDYGRAMPLNVAKYLIVCLRWADGQSQFSPSLDLQAALDSTVLQQCILDGQAVDTRNPSRAQTTVY
ncbi:hypothetical protein [Paraburkholderia flagellata]|uniref:hypothetical protein n=1 Tax=Paraburkholderia flagellata TaxID=2883241 RepID=UPI001F2191BD|nr:hypothetical protein [Paraburkholderia flagellata]